MITKAAAESNTLSSQRSENLEIESHIIKVKQVKLRYFVKYQREERKMPTLVNTISFMGFFVALRNFLASSDYRLKQSMLRKYH